MMLISQGKQISVFKFKGIESLRLQNTCFTISIDASITNNNISLVLSISSLD